MKINLDYPFNQDWKNGYLRENPQDNRKLLDLVNSDTDRTTISYARYLKSVEVGYYLSDDVEVDHIDKDCTNDDLSNLQILTIEEHREKTRLENTTGRTTDECKCANCGILFTRETRLILHNNNQKNIFCSKRCNGQFNSANFIEGNKTVDYIKVQEYLDEGLFDTEIAKIMNINKNSVLNYRKANGIPSKKFANRNILENNIEEIKNLLTSGVKTSIIAKKLNVKYGLLKSFINKHNL